jgi:hypothetical protein
MASPCLTNRTNVRVELCLGELLFLVDAYVCVDAQPVGPCRENSIAITIAPTSTRHEVCGEEFPVGEACPLPGFRARSRKCSKSLQFGLKHLDDDRLRLRARAVRSDELLSETLEVGTHRGLRSVDALAKLSKK